MASSRSPGSPVVCFGVYEADLRSGELRKQGQRIRLPEQPFQVLAILLEHPGEVVPRESLRKRLWPDGTFVDFEQGLNAAVKRLREALDDSAETPRLIETLPRRGYRFIGPAELAERITLPWNVLDIADAITVSPYASEEYEQQVRQTVASISAPRLT